MDLNSEFFFISTHPFIKSIATTYLRLVHKTILASMIYLDKRSKIKCKFHCYQ